MSEISREAIKTLAIAVGVREAARQTGLNPNTVLAWSRRDNWFSNTPKPPSVLKQAGQAISALKTPSNALAGILSARKAKSRAYLSKYVVNGAKVAARSRSPLADAGKVKDLAAVMEKVWPEEREDVQRVSLNLLQMGGRD